MRSVLFDHGRIVRAAEVPDPVAGPGEAVVSVAYAGICGSDLRGIKEGGRRTPPLIMGHEFSAVTSDGTRVAINAMVGCGKCDLCEIGRNYVCRDRQVIGVDRDGGFAELAAVPENALVELPERVSLETGALVEPLAVALRAWRNAGIKGDGERVGVIGAGNVGLMALTVARHFGAEVDVADPMSSRLDVARSHGAKHVGASLEGEYEAVFDAVGSTETHATAVHSTRPGGTAVWIGAHTRDPGFDAIELVNWERRLVTVLGYSHRDFVDAVDLAAKLSLDWAVVRPLDAGADIFNDLAAGRASDLKVLLAP